MQSPKFDMRAKELLPLFTAAKLKAIWEKKIRLDMRKQHIVDAIDHIDFHISSKDECAAIEAIIRAGDYKPGDCRRVLVEKSKGLCRQLVIPKVQDAIVLQCLSDALYQDIKYKSPTSKAFFEQEDHAFSEKTATFVEPEYGSFKSWLNFQKAIFKFSEEKKFLIVTDIANFYDCISYSNLRNIISDIIDVRESVLDMLIFSLSGMLWQPDYMPRNEIGLPQINLEAPRILAHCFLYELDKYLHINKVDFVRFMDDIDVGVNSIPEAKQILKNIDLMLQTRHVRLNSGKTLILSAESAIKHFCIRENHAIGRGEERINKKVKLKLPLNRERNFITKVFPALTTKKFFDQGNGEKILKRLMRIASEIGVNLKRKTLLDILIRRPNSRKSALKLISRMPLTQMRANVLKDYCSSGYIVDDASYADVAYHLVETPVTIKANINLAIQTIIDGFPLADFFGLYSKIWLMSKYSSTKDMLEIIEKSRNIWKRDYWLGRLIGGMSPIFANSTEFGKFKSLIINSGNNDAIGVYAFHESLETDTIIFDEVYKYINARNTSLRLGIKHSKFLLLISALRNKHADPKKIAQLKKNHLGAASDCYYRSILKRTTSDPFWVKSTMLTYPMP